MDDARATLAELKKQAAQFVAERDWNQFHNPKSLIMNLSVEVAELMEPFIWPSSQNSLETLEKNRKHIEEEVADVLLGLLNFANACNIDIAQAFTSKMKLNAEKYPIEKAKGKHDKYTML